MDRVIVGAVEEVRELRRVTGILWRAIYAMGKTSVVNSTPGGGVLGGVNRRPEERNSIGVDELHVVCCRVSQTMFTQKVGTRRGNRDSQDGLTDNLEGRRSRPRQRSGRIVVQDDGKTGKTELKKAVIEFRRKMS